MRFIAGGSIGTREKSFPRQLRLAKFPQQMTALSSPPPVPHDSPSTDIESLWRATQKRLEKSVPESTYRLWLEPLEAVGADADTLYLKAPEGIRA